MLGGIFISYRREDSAPYARLLRESLGGYFGDDQIFRDIDTIGPGVDFPEAIAAAVGSCKVLLAVIGDKWLTAEKNGVRRLDDAGDYVRLEIAAALERGVLVVPVLLEQTRMPGKADLPPNLAELADRNAMRLTDDGWDDAVRRLATALRRQLGPDLAGGGDGPPAKAGTLSTGSGGTGTGTGGTGTGTGGTGTGTGGTGGGTGTGWSASPAPVGTGTGTGSAPPSPYAGTGTGTGTGDGGGKRTPVGLIAGGVLAVVAILVIGIAVLGGGGDDGGTATTTTAARPATTASSGPTSSGPPTSVRVTFGTRPGGILVNPTFALDPSLFLPSVKASPATGGVGTTVTLSGARFGANERVNFDFGGTSVGNTRTDGNGDYSGFTFRVPNGARAGDVEITAAGQSSDAVAKVTFRVT